MQDHEKAFYEVVEKAQKYDSLLLLKNSNTIHCSFCGKAQEDVAKLVAGPRAFICDECIGLCVEMLKEEGAESNGQG